MHIPRKTISPVVATALLLVVAIVAVVSFQSWFQVFSSDTLIRSEQQTDSISGLGIVDVKGNTLYYRKNEDDENLTIKSVQVEKRDCAINRNVSSELTSLSLDECLENASGPTEMTVVTDSGVTSEKVYIPTSTNDNNPGNGPDQGAFITEWRTNYSGVSGNKTITLPLKNSGTYNFTVQWGDGTNDTITSWDDADRSHTYASKGVYNITITGTFDWFAFGTNSDAGKLLAVHAWGDEQLPDSGYQFADCRNLRNVGNPPNIPSLENMSSMFENATEFNQDISAWDVSNVTDMGSMFRNAESFNQDLNQWDMSGVTAIDGMFYDAKSFNGSVNQWNTSRVKDMYGTFTSAVAFNRDLSNWDTSKVTNMGFMFGETDSFNQDISNWNTSSVTDMEWMFYHAQEFNQNLSEWDTSNVKNMELMFRSASSFNGDISGWNTSKVTSMNLMFAETSVFNQDISNWNTSSVTDMGWMFYSADAFTQDISSWCVEQISSKPSNFDLFAGFEGQSSKQPNWGDTC